MKRSSLSLLTSELCLVLPIVSARASCNEWVARSFAGVRHCFVQQGVIRLACRVCARVQPLITDVHTLSDCCSCTARTLECQDVVIALRYQHVVIMQPVRLFYVIHITVVQASGEACAHLESMATASTLYALNLQVRLCAAA